MNNRGAGAGVFEVVTIIVRRQKRIHHRDDCSNARCPEPAPDKLWTIGQHKEYAIFHLNPDFAQRIARPIRHADSFTVIESLIAEIQTGFVFAAFLYVVVEEIIGHVEAFRKLGSHVQVRFSQTDSPAHRAYCSETCAPPTVPERISCRASSSNSPRLPSRPSRASRRPRAQ